MRADGRLTASNATITGKITATSGVFSGNIESTHLNADSGSIGGFAITSNAISSSHLILSSSIGGGEVISASQFNVRADGRLTASNANIIGKITATSGVFSGNIEATHLNADSGSIGGFAITPNAISSSHLIISKSTGGGEIISASQFNVRADGRLTASNATITGKITATSGVFSGNIEATHLNADSGSIGGFSITPNAISSSHLIISKSTGGGEIISASQFNVRADGRLTASNATITGKITATSGVFTGNIESTHLNADSGSIGGFAITPNAISSSHLIISQSTGGGEIISASQFNVRADGRLTASNANIIGKITATSGVFTGNIESTHLNADSGSIGGFAITPNAISSSHLIISQSVGGGEIISASKFNVRADGRLTASNVNITGKVTATSGIFSGNIEATHLNADSGSIGGFAITPNAISSSHLIYLLK